MNIIEVKSLYKVFGEKENKLEAVKNINLEIKEGQFVVIVGASGSGKSTLLHLIGLVDKATSGEIYIDGKNTDILSDDEKAVFRLRKIGFVFQFFNLINMLNVDENIEMPVLLDDDKVDQEYKKELVSILGIQDKLKNMPSELSGGQQQRVSIARALINKPSIVLADEPTGNLDSKNAVEIINLLKYTSKKYNQTLVVITHDEKIANLADRVITIKDGSITNDEVLNE